MLAHNLERRAIILKRGIIVAYGGQGSIAEFGIEVDLQLGSQQRSILVLAFFIRFWVWLAISIPVKWSAKVVDSETLLAFFPEEAHYE